MTQNFKVGDRVRLIRTPDNIDYSNLYYDGKTDFVVQRVKVYPKDSVLFFSEKDTAGMHQSRVELVKASKLINSNLKWGILDKTTGEILSTIWRTRDYARTSKNVIAKGNSKNRYKVVKLEIKILP